jgi:catalase
MVDALFLPGGWESVQTLSRNGRAMHRTREAFGHLKPIGATGEAIELVGDAVALREKVVVSDSEEVRESYGVVSLRKVINGPESFGGKEGTPVKIAKGGKGGFMETSLWAVAAHRNWERELDRLSVRVAY